MVAAGWEYFSDALTWTNAQATCASRGGALVSVLSAEMNEALSVFVEENTVEGGNGDVWIGGNDLDEEVLYMWVLAQGILLQCA